MKIGALASAGLLSLVICGASASGADMKYPDWESQWRNPKAGQRGNPWDITKPMGLGQEAPLTPEYQAIFEASLKDQAAGGQGANRTGSCALSGIPRIMSLAAPMEILIQPSTTYMIFLATLPRRIYTDGRGWPKDEPATFLGYSIGKWIDTDHDGTYDELDIETRNFLGPRTLESTGLPLHKDNQSIVKERLFLDKEDKNALHDEITIIDHAFTHPWTVTKTYVREPNPEWLEWNCHEANNHVFIGKEEYFLSADRDLMPVRAGQPPPDLQYFEQPQK